MKRTDKERLERIISLWQELNEAVKDYNINEEVLLENHFCQWAVTTPISNIGEQVYWLSSDFKDRYKEIDWDAVSGMRHRLVHDYDGIDWNIVANVLFSEMEIFVSQVQQILSEL